MSADSSVRAERQTRDGIPVGAVPAMVVVLLLLGGALAGALDTSLHPGRIVGGGVGSGA